MWHNNTSFQKGPRLWKSTECFLKSYRQLKHSHTSLTGLDWPVRYGSKSLSWTVSFWWREPFCTKMKKHVWILVIDFDLTTNMLQPMASYVAWKASINQRKNSTYSEELHWIMHDYSNVYVIFCESCTRCAVWLQQC